MKMKRKRIRQMNGCMKWKKIIYKFSILFLLILASCTNKEQDESQTDNNVTVTPTLTNSVSIDEINSNKTEEAIDIENNSIEIGFLYAFDYWNLYDYSNAAYPTQGEYEEAITNGIEDIATFLGKEDWLKQYDTKYKTLFVKLDINSSIKGGHMTIPVQYTADSLVCELGLNPVSFTDEVMSDVIFHELTHMITYNPNLKRYSISLALNDGLCEYVHYSIWNSKDGSFCGIDFQSYIIRSIEKMLNASEENQSVSDRVIADIGLDSATYLYPAFSDEWNCSYKYNSSFARYIIDSYGLDYFLLLHDPYEDSDLMAEHQAELYKLKDEWLDFLKEYPCTMTYEEMEEYFKTYNE